MQEATGQTGLMNIMLTIIGIIIILLAGSIAYSKAFRVKNRIIDVIERSNGFDSAAKNKIEVALTEIGYKTIDSSKYSTYCDKDKFDGFNLETQAYPGHLYCVYKKKSGNLYYKVIAYMYFDIPLIGNSIFIPVTGETKVIYTSTDSWKTVE